MAARKSKAKKKSRTTKLQADKIEKVKVGEVLKDERSFKIAGTFLILVGIFLFIAFTSYLFTWDKDYSEVIKGASILVKDTTKEISNSLGAVGAYFSDLFFRRGFGVSSYLFCLFFFVLGLNLVAKDRMFSIWKNVRYVIVGVIVFSVTFSFFTHSVDRETVSNSPEFFWGGRFGDHVNEWLQAKIGLLGTALLIIVCFFSYIIWQFNPVFNVRKAADHLGSLVPKKDPANDEELETTDEDRADESELEILPLMDVQPDSKPDKSAAKTQLIVKKAEEPVQPLSPFPKKISSGTGVTLEVKNSETLHESGVQSQPEVRTKKEGLPPDTQPYDPKDDLRDYKYPTIDLLEDHGDERIVQDASELEANKNKIEETLGNYNIGIQKIYATVGPTVTLYEIIPDPGVRISKIRNLEDDIALSLAALGIRIIAPIPGKGTIGIEVPNKKRTLVGMKSLLGSEKFRNSNYQLPIALGKKIDNENFIADLASMPHLLMAGATGQGKSVGLNAILVSLLYKKHPSQIKFVLIDPKKVELSIYRNIEKHFLAKLPNEEEAIVTDTKKVIYTLNALGTLMDIRYNLLKDAGARNIKEYNKKFVSRRLNPLDGHKFLPFIVLVIDEFADLIMTAGKEIELPLARLAQLSRAVGIHLVIATQRPSVNIITGIIKANFPARIAFKVSSKIDSRTILDTGGADQLIGKGDMLVSYNGEITRVQCAFVDTPEVDKITAFIGDQRGYPSAYELPEYDEGELDPKSVNVTDRDSRFGEAARLIVQSQSGSTSLIQRKMQLGYNRAGRIMDQLEAAGIVGPPKGSKPRDVLVASESELDMYLQT